MKTLLAIVEQGGHPDFTSLYESLGYKVITAASMRKALNLIKQHKPDVITAEFIYSPMYSARISNIESLFAMMQSHQLDARLIVFVEKEDLHHLDSLEMQDLISEQLTYPIDINKLSFYLHLPNNVM